MLTLILGGARSGKSALAERVASDSAQEVVYVATAQAFDEEMASRIVHHRARRPASWRSIEEPLALAATLRAHAATDRLLLVDCLTLWLSNLLGADDTGERLVAELAALFDVLPGIPGDVVFVSNEVGLGITPLGELTRRFVDEAGRLHQALAARCDRVIFVAAGLPMTLKGTPP
ncbi:bifunctional adenosylcobinamide kinase/adenosylcobinamide-phosphate guanylyltransferase [Luteibacter sp. 3190]|uniref:bifunctional adenosylcobinamide kinase/adenosylcobinamide-phosphate guanylyltransferase n=1 Tax=Luteibacter sp. 3190 TaxID=2817736 RepID=UPI0028637782|nr:bifunctional adenosylcobinamide kinase/adenosylcobinamide-phosphate guanylyltransferase [Luteibacter sp. 3190]MDR6937279.1 adenosylcobinamide kinase/adenosylcobinamide-phosphate guanylyltransferase [Luteibacter sp. 3190]